MDSLSPIWQKKAAFLLDGRRWPILAQIFTQTLIGLFFRNSFEPPKGDDGLRARQFRAAIVKHWSACFL